MASGDSIQKCSAVTGVAGVLFVRSRGIITSALLIILLALVSACASGPPSYRQNIQSAIGGRGSVSVEIREDGIVILRGWVENTYEKNAVLRAARRGEGITRVIDWIHVMQDFP